MIIALLLLLPFSLSAFQEFNTTASASVEATDGMPSSFVNQSVDAISGQYCEGRTEFTIQGPEPLVFARRYTSGDCSGNLGKCWHFNHGDVLLMSPGRDVVMARCDGPAYSFKATLKNQQYSFKLRLPNGLTNCASGYISGRTNLKNHGLQYISGSNEVKITTPKGKERHFDFYPAKGVCSAYVQRQEIGKDGNGIVYERPQDSLGLTAIKSLNHHTKKVYGWVKIKWPEKPEKNSDVHLKTSDGRSIHYQYLRHSYKTKEESPYLQSEYKCVAYYLEKAENSEKPTERFSYTSSARRKNVLLLNCKKLPEGRFLKTDYYTEGSNRLDRLGTFNLSKGDFRLDRVKSQSAPVGVDQKPIITHRFVYHEKADGSGSTDIFDAYFRKTAYLYTKDKRLFCITKYMGTENYNVATTEHYFWGQGDNETHLMATCLKDAAGTIKQAHCYGTVNKLDS